LDKKNFLAFIFKNKIITIERAQSIATSHKDSHSDTKLAVNDNDNVNDNVIIMRKGCDRIKFALRKRCNKEKKRKEKIIIM
jgi:hypothetical protein